MSLNKEKIIKIKSNNFVKLNLGKEVSNKFAKENNVNVVEIDLKIYLETNNFT